MVTAAGTGAAGFAGDYGPAPSATLNSVYGLTVASGHLLIADTKNNAVRMVW